MNRSPAYSQLSQLGKLQCVLKPIIRHYSPQDVHTVYSTQLYTWRDQSCVENIQVFVNFFHKKNNCVSAKMQLKFAIWPKFHILKKFSQKYIFVSAQGVIVYGACRQAIGLTRQKMGLTSYRPGQAEDGPIYRPGINQRLQNCGLCASHMYTVGLAPDQIYECT